MGFVSGIKGCSLLCSLVTAAHLGTEQIDKAVWACERWKLNGTPGRHQTDPEPAPEIHTTFSSPTITLTSDAAAPLEDLSTSPPLWGVNQSYDTAEGKLGVRAGLLTAGWYKFSAQWDVAGTATGVVAGDGVSNVGVDGGPSLYLSDKHYYLNKSIPYPPLTPTESESGLLTGKIERCIEVTAHDVSDNELIDIFQYSGNAGVDVTKWGWGLAPGEVSGQTEVTITVSNLSFKKISIGYIDDDSPIFKP